MNYDFYGTHIICDAYGIPLQLFTDISKIKKCVTDSVKHSGASLVDIISYEFDNGGFTLVALLKESHVSLHAYPEKQAMFIDVFTCGKIEPMGIIVDINKFFMPAQKKIKIITRGIKDKSS